MTPELTYLSPEFRPGAVRVLAHRGLASAHETSGSDSSKTIEENTIEAFQNALMAGADYVESDIQVTSDGVPVLFHDDDLLRVANRVERIDQLTWSQLEQISMPSGGKIPTLEQALIELPEARFNLDFKVAGAISPAVAVINQLGAQNRVLVASFSEARRKSASEQIDGAVASSAGSIRVIWLFLAHQIRFDRLFGLIAKPVSALQLPTKVAFLRFAKPSFIERAQKHGLEVHFWTINSAEEMSELILMGADGLVTDRADLARQISDSLA